MFGWEYPPLISGGLGVACYGLTKGIARQGGKITLVLPRYYEKSPKFVKIVSTESIQEKLDSGKTLKKQEVMPIISGYLRPEDYEQWYREETVVGSKARLIYGPDIYGEIERFARLSRKVAEAGDFDIIHCHDWITYQAGMEAKKILGIPLVMHVHSIEADRAPYPNPRICEMEKSGLNAADLIMCVSRYTLEQVKKNYQIPESKMVVVHNGVELAGCAKPGRRPARKKRVRQILYLGRLTWQKGPEYLVEIAKKMLEKRTDLRFVLAGWGDLAHPIVERVADWGVGDHILFAGFLDEIDVKKLIRSSDLFLMPSVSEPFGLVALEALSHGVPAVISNQSGVAELLDYVPKADFWDIEQFAQLALQLLASPKLAEKQLKNIWPTLEKLNWNDSGKICMENYQRLMAGTAS